jgi:hypothetical protein
MEKRSVYKELTRHGEIRILELLPGRSRKPLSCKLKHITLGQNHEYQALSYEWGCLKGTGKVWCGSVDIEVTLNLIRALKVLRHEKKSRWLWVDALCIDQEDNEERSKQVPLMREIYAKAQIVLVWLGNESAMSRNALEILESLALVCIQRMGKNVGQENFFPFIFQKGEPLFTSKNDMCWLSTVEVLRAAQQGEEAEPYVLPARDDTIFRFDDTLLWKEVHDIFGSSYFERSWIIQEVSVAYEVKIVCVEWTIPWEIFKHAYRGWQLISRISPINEAMHEVTIDKTASFSGVRDARARFRAPPEEFNSDLACVLATFNYAKQTNPHDHIYAALGLVTAPLQRTLPIVPDYNKQIDEVFIEAATQIINERQDLYLWGFDTLLSARSPEMISLPTWVPEWTATNNEEGKGRYTRHFSTLVPGYFEIQGRRLLVDGIVDKIAWVAPELIIFLAQRFPLLVHLEESLRKGGSGILKPYPEGFSDTGSSEETSGSLILGIGYLRRLRDFIKILVEFIPNITKLISELQRIVLPFKSDNVTSNLESLWSVLTPSRPLTTPEPPPLGEKLFLAFLYLGSTHNGTSESIIRIDDLLSTIPIKFMVWTIAASCLHASGNTLRQTAMFAFCLPHLMRFRMDGESLFLTEKGRFGRAPSSDVKAHHTVAIIGGAWAPHILEKHESYYTLVSHAYVHGLEDLKAPLGNMSVERIELR